jgi:hypothetical protein
MRFISARPARPHQPPAHTALFNPLFNPAAALHKNIKPGFTQPVFYTTFFQYD